MRISDELLNFLGDFFVEVNLEEKLNTTFIEFVESYLRNVEYSLKCQTQ